ncbi:MAG: (Dimethylallyl)adenosine tRNA methylthiotransferase MiaB [Syntrophorhabdaceae bacterium PtaU1.Bin034]|nr:MAG: (Dimethylallyl)adenosine tRNA methylthiotransferase MiaB [Syntrophorhabdaceae bacterium PtaU1.Bin034]
MSGPRFLIVRLPCRKIYPVGPVYLASLIRRAAPDSDLHLLDLAVIDPSKRKSVLREAVQRHRPQVLAFSWRDIQIFSPHDMDSAMRDSFTFFYDPSPFLKFKAAVNGLVDIVSYRGMLAHDFALIREASKITGPDLIAVGGPSVKIFSEFLRPHLPGNVRLVLRTEDFFSLVGLPLPDNPLEPAIDIEALEETFPQWSSYRGEEIGVQTKRGCPLNCLYCLYGFLEGKHMEQREPGRVAQEVQDYHTRWEIKRFWFVDAQLLSNRGDADHLEAILRQLLQRRLDITWSGYLRINRLTTELAGLMVKTGVKGLEIALNSGAQSVLDELRMGFSVEETMEGFRVLKSAGYRGEIKIDLALNSPGETRETLKETLKVVQRVRNMGFDRVTPVIFFLAIQPNTGLEKKALESGHLKPGYSPISVWPQDVRKLIYNPPPLDKLVGRCCARAFRTKDAGGDEVLSCLAAELASPEIP